jgi:hypothetical protein
VSEHLRMRFKAQSVLADAFRRVNDPADADGRDAA